MNMQQMERIKNGSGFIAALDQSGGSTPKALKSYGIDESAYNSEKEMFELIHQMRSRIIKSKSFTSDYILGAIIFEKTMDSQIDGLFTADYLWQKKGIVPFLKVDNGLSDKTDGVQLMKPIPQLDALLKRAKERNIFGTKMRSVIHEANEEGIKAVIEQQFNIAQHIFEAGLVPIIEPEIDINSPDKKQSEDIMLSQLKSHINALEHNVKIMLKVSIPTVAGLYSELMDDKRVIRVVALSGGYSRNDADRLLYENPGLIASFSRALLSDLSVEQSDEEFDKALSDAISEIYKASVKEK